MYICRVPHKFRMKEIAHILPNWSTRAILLLDRILQGLAGLEHRGLGGGNLDRLLRLGIAPSAVSQSFLERPLISDMAAINSFLFIGNLLLSVVVRSNTPAYYSRLVRKMQLII